MFELTVAFKYLIPRWRQLSVSIISLISIVVIALVVWLILVFFSVTHGLEKSWVSKIIAITAPVRLMPTQAYYDSYYYQIDTIASSSNYTPKSLGEKLSTRAADPYDPDIDERIPKAWNLPIKDLNGDVKDLAKIAYLAAKKAQGTNEIKVTPFETSAASLQLKLNRDENQSVLNYPAYLGSYDPENEDLLKTLQPLSENDTLRGYKEGGKTPLPKGSVILPKTFREGGVLVGDRGHISYYLPTTSTVQEQKIPVTVVGFYDQGVMSLGGKFVWVNPEIVETINAAYDQNHAGIQSGFNVRFADLNDAPRVKSIIEKELEDAGIADYWKVETYKEYPFTKDFLQQLNSEKNLFTILSLVIIVVACSNIISMLTILVNDKRMEIGVLRAMGASSVSIAAIFGVCGIVMGALGSLLGIGLAYLTLQNLDALISFISRMQGHELFNHMFYGDTIPHELSSDALGFVLLATIVISLVSGIVPAVKASLLRPSAILRSE